MFVFLLVIGIAVLAIYLFLASDTKWQLPQKVDVNKASKLIGNSQIQAMRTAFQSSLIEAISTTNISEWRSAIKELKQLEGSSSQKWVMEQSNRLVGIPITLTQKTNTVQFNAVLIVISAQGNTGNLIEVDMQSQNINIDEARKMGLELCNLFGFEENEFIKWCDNVGSNWLDMPLFGKSNHYFGFQIIRTYANDKPWCVQTLLMHP